MMNPALKAKLTAQAIKAYNLQQFGVEKIDIVKMYNIESRKPLTLFIFHYDWAVMAEERVHPNEMVQNLEHNGHREGRRKFVKQFITDAVKKHKAKMSKKKAEANSIGNMFPELSNLKLA
jgi:hypothetical protein